MLATLLLQLKTLLLGLTTAVALAAPKPFAAIHSISPTAVNRGSAGTSQNWSGYAATTGPYTAISGTWTVPQATSSGHTATDASWVGIGGVTSSDLIQAGTEDEVNTSNQETTSAFYELLPNASTQIPLTVKAGDTVTASLTQQSTGQWTINFTDNTTGNNWSTSVSYNSSLSSAEWIEEAPSNGQVTLPLDNFGTIPFSAGSATANGTSESISQANAQAITMINAQNQAVATPSALSSDGASFSVTRSSAVSNSPSPAFDRNPRGWYRRGGGIGRFRGRWHPWANVSPTPTATPTATPTPTPTPTSTASSTTSAFGRRFSIPSGSTPIFGQVTGVNGSQLTIQTFGQNSGTQTIDFNGSTQYTNGASQSSLVTGIRIAGYGTTNSDGSITAQQLTVFQQQQQQQPPQRFGRRPFFQNFHF